MYVYIYIYIDRQIDPVGLFEAGIYIMEEKKCFNQIKDTQGGQ